MIPKVIHYCWFGRGKMPELANKCIESWKKYCPDYEIIEWNEDNFDINCCPYVKEAYESKRFAFVTDYVRLYAMYTQGGIYMDTDVEVLRNLDEFLIHQGFWDSSQKHRFLQG
ncbi:MAG: glycosyltransferase [Lachnoclostridium sp.]